MIYLIGGAPRCGKSILATRISQTHHISWIATDALRPVILEYLPTQEIHRLMPFENNGSEQMTAQESLSAEIQESKTLWPGIQRLIKQLIDMRQEYIIEGVHLLPEHVAELQKSSYGKQMQVLYLIKENIPAIIDGFKKNTAPFDWMANCLEDETILQTMGEMVALKGGFIRAQAEQYRFPVYNTENNFQATLDMLSEKIIR